MKSILLVEDDVTLLSFLQDLLREEGYIVDGVSQGARAIQKVSERKPDIVLLDLTLPDLAGETVLTHMKKDYPQLPVIILTAKIGVENIAKGLNIGADDYLEKPFAREELLARIKARLRSNGDDKEEYKIADLVVNLATREAKRGKKNISLTKTEFNLLFYLIKNQGRVVTRDMILNHVWGYNTDIESRVVDIYIGYLRKKICYDFPTRLIYCKRGIGYVMRQRDVSI